MMLCYYGWRQLLQTLDNSLDGLVDREKHQEQIKSLEKLVSDMQTIQKEQELANSNSKKKHNSKTHENLIEHASALLADIKKFTQMVDTSIKAALLHYHSEFPLWTRLNPLHSSASEYYTSMIEPLYKSQRLAYSRLEDSERILESLSKMFRQAA